MPSFKIHLMRLSSEGGGETIRVIFEEKLVSSLLALNIRDFYSPKNVKAVIDAADGYQPHLVGAVRAVLSFCDPWL